MKSQGKRTPSPGPHPAADRPAKRSTGTPEIPSAPTVPPHLSSPCPDALGKERNLPAALARAALDPPVAIALPDLQQNLERGGVRLGGELALRRVASGPRIVRVERSRPGAGLVVVLGPADALRDPMPALDLGPLAENSQAVPSTSGYVVGAAGFEPTTSCV